MADFNVEEKTRMRFHDLYRGEAEDGLVLVGRRDIASYMSIPAEAVEVIDLLDSGKTVGEVKALLMEKYGEEVEIEEFLRDLIKNEMVKSVDGVELATMSRQQTPLFRNITQHHVGWMFSRYAKVVYLSISIVCVAVFVAVPDYRPVPRDAFFHPWYSVAVAFMFFFGWTLAALHELAHLFAAKSVGVEGSFSVSHRLVFLVAQTNLGNIWTIPRGKRYIVYVAGMAWEMVIIFGCLMLLLFSDRGLVTLSNLVYNLLKAVIFMCVWGVIWQFRFNMQTDIYYVLATFLKCRNLLGDAQTLIKNVLSTVIKRIERVDMSTMPEREMKVIKWYTLLYGVGTFVTLATYFLRNIPLLLLQVMRALEGIHRGYAGSPSDFVDAVVLIGLNTFYYGLLGFLVLTPRWGTIRQGLHALIART